MNAQLNNIFLKVHWFHKEKYSLHTASVRSYCTLKRNLIPVLISLLERKRLDPGNHLTLTEAYEACGSKPQAGELQAFILLEA